VNENNKAEDEAALAALNRLIHEKLSPKSLEDRAPNLPVEDQIALSDADIRRKVSIWIMGLFGVVNGITLVLLIGLAWLDQQDLVRGLIKPGDRLVDAQVLLGLLGATTVQLGAIAVIMARYIFPGPAVDAKG